MDEINNMFQMFDNQNNIMNENMFHNFELFEAMPNNNENRNRKYTVYPRIDPFIRYNDNDFRERYRLTKEQVNDLFDLLDGRTTLDPQVKCSKLE